MSPTHCNSLLFAKVVIRKRGGHSGTPKLLCAHSAREQGLGGGGRGEGRRASGDIGGTCWSSFSAAPGLVTGGVIDQIRERQSVGCTPALGQVSAVLASSCLFPLGRHEGQAFLCPVHSFIHSAAACAENWGWTQQCLRQLWSLPTWAPGPEEREKLRLEREPGPRGQGLAVDTQQRGTWRALQPGPSG